MSDFRRPLDVSPWPREQATNHQSSTGCYAPASNQVSLEKNVLFFQRLLSEQKHDAARYDFFFSDGEAPGRDVQYRDPAEDVPRANRLMAQLFGKDNDLGLSYRNHQVPSVRGAASRENIERWFREVGSKLAAGDRLLLYVTAHGGKSKEEKNPYDTKLYLWNHHTITASELAAELDRLDDGVSVVLVMVQCYAGGFAHLIFNEADADQGVTGRNRCGFFATLHDRPAAGCTADIDEANYQEYSSFFWAALGAKTRTGQRIETPDYNRDGAVSLDEAHAYSMLASETVDVPVKTSDAFLRAASRMTGDVAYEELLRLAPPSEKAVLEGLSRQLDLDASGRQALVRTAAEEIQNERKNLADRRQRMRDRCETIEKEIRRDLEIRWPELANVLNPRALALLDREANEFVRAVESHRDYSELARLRQEIEANQTERLDLQRQWAKCQRWLRTADNVLLAAHLPRVASPEIQRRYRQLLALEQSTLAGDPSSRSATTENEEGPMSTRPLSRVRP